MAGARRHVALTHHHHAASDAQLVAAMAGRDEDALALLYDRHAAAAYGLALRILWDASAAEDVVQEAFLALWRDASRYHPERGAVRAWLLGIVRHRAIDQLRGPQRRTGRPLSLDLMETPAPAPDDPAAEALRSIDGATVRAALDALPSEQRAVVELAYFGGLSHGEIAGRTGVPLGTVKGRMRLAVERLRKALRGHDPAYVAPREAAR
jgi:RNA polymerase sigma-70 factor (ECF subfamily)